MMHSRIDHLVVTAPSLQEGSAFVSDLLGAPLQPGGFHPRMGTHNALLRLGETSYLEVIAIDPEAHSPGRPRWFRLDHETMKDRTALCGWVASTSDIQAAADEAGQAFGPIEPMSRDALRWRITVPQDGSMPFSGIAPLFIQWDSGLHPCTRLEDRGCALVGIEAFHPQAETIQALLSAMGFAGDFVVSMPGPGVAPHVIAHIRTPGGLRRLTSLGALRG